ncbi:nitrate- and nitrite sensing domain-containing protein [Comamonas sp.]
MDNALHFLNAARQCEINELQQLLRTSSLVRALGELIHALQKERGLSNILLASEGSRGSVALTAQRQDCDHHIAMLRQTLDVLDVHSLQGGQGARLCSHIAYVLQGLDALPALRQQVLSLALTASVATQAYSRLITGLLSVVFEAADSATSPRISRLLVAMFHFMQGKELAGQERATGAAAFSAGISQIERQQHWLHLIESQERCLQVFKECAPEDLVQAWEACCTSGADITTLERLRRIGCTATDGSALSRDLGEVWFDVCSSLLDGMHRIEAQLAEALTHDCQMLLSHAQASLSAPASHTAIAVAACSEDTLPEFFTGPAPAHWDSPLSAPFKLPMLQVVQEQSQRLQSMRNELDSVRQALTERKTVERAKGVLMTHQKLSESEAHKLLRQTAMSQNRRIVDVAEAVLSMADLLAQPSA